MSRASLSILSTGVQPSEGTPNSSESQNINMNSFMLKPLRIGVVGCGYWGAKHVRVLCNMPSVRETVIVEPDPAIRERISKAFPAARPFASLKLAIPHVDAVILATPPSSHAALAMQALRAGKHVLIEKPITTSLRDARRLIAEAERAGVVLMAGHTFEFNPAVRELRRRIESGELGKIYYIHSSRLSLGLYRPDVNVVWDLAPHDISIMNFLLRSTPSSVQAWVSSHARTGVVDLAQGRLEYGHAGVTCYFHVSWLDPRKVRQVTVVGSKKMAVYDDLAEERLRLFDRGVEQGEAEMAQHELPITYRYGDIVAPYIQSAEPLRMEDQHFIDSICLRTKPETDGICGAVVVAVLEAIDRSIVRGRPCAVELPPELVVQGEVAFAV